MVDNRTLIQKADLALADLLADGGLLQPAQAQRFMRILIKEAKLMKLVTVVPMRSHKQLIEKIRFSGRVLKPGNEATALAVGDRSKPDLSNEELDAKLFKAEVRLNDETLEDNIENDNLKNTVMQLMGEAISRDMEDVMVNGDTASADPTLAVLDGVLKQATSNLVGPVAASLTKTVLRDMLKTMPTEFIRNKKLMSFFTSVDSQIDYAESISTRETVLGDRFFQEDVPPAFNGVPVVDVPLFPVTGGETSVLLTDPKNINLGIWRQIKMETDRDISAGVLVIVATLRFDVKFAEETATVKATGVTGQIGS